MGKRLGDLLIGSRWCDRPSRDNLRASPQPSQNWPAVSSPSPPTQPPRGPQPPFATHYSTPSPPATCVTTPSKAHDAAPDPARSSPSSQHDSHGVATTIQPVQPYYHHPGRHQLPTDLLTHMGHGHGTGQKSQRRSERPGRQQLSSGVRLQGSHPWEASREAGRSQTSSSGESQPAASPWMSENGTCHASSQHPAQTEMATGTLIPAKVSSGNPWVSKGDASIRQARQQGRERLDACPAGQPKASRSSQADLRPGLGICSHNAETSLRGSSAVLHRDLHKGLSRSQNADALTRASSASLQRVVQASAPARVPVRQSQPVLPDWRDGSGRPAAQQNHVLVDLHPGSFRAPDGGSGTNRGSADASRQLDLYLQGWLPSPAVSSDESGAHDAQLDVVPGLGQQQGSFASQHHLADNDARAAASASASSSGAASSSYGDQEIQADQCWAQGSLHSSYVPSSATTSAAQQDARNRQEWRIKAQNPAGSAGLHEEAQGVLKGRPYATEHSAQVSIPTSIECLLLITTCGPGNALMSC